MMKVHLAYMLVVATATLLAAGGCTKAKAPEASPTSVAASLAAPGGMMQEQSVQSTLPKAPDGNPP